MASPARESDSWAAATLDFLLAAGGFVLVWYPIVHFGNALLGAPATDATVNLVVGVLAFGGAYPVVAGDWSLGRLGEFVFVLFAGVLGWGAVGAVLVLASGASLSGGDVAPLTLVWAAAYATAYAVVYRRGIRIFR